MTVATSNDLLEGLAQLEQWCSADSGYRAYTVQRRYMWRVTLSTTRGRQRLSRRTYFSEKLDEAARRAIADYVSGKDRMR